MPEAILVSACLLGLHTRYDGSRKFNDKVIEYLERNDFIPVPVCPEQLAGLPTPREESHFEKGDGLNVVAGDGLICTKTGRILNEIFLHGAAETLMVGKLAGCRTALLKERSPSCGVHSVYRSGQSVPGMGVTTALLKKEEFSVLSEDDL